MLLSITTTTTPRNGSKKPREVYVGGVVSSQGNESRDARSCELFLFGVIDVSQTPKCFRYPDNLDVTLLLWVVGQLRWLGVPLVLMKLKILEKNVGEIGERD